MTGAARSRTAHQESVHRFKPYPHYKDSAVEWLGTIPAHWHLRRLRSTVTTCQNGVWGDEPNGVHDVPCVRVADFDRIAFRVKMLEPTFRLIKEDVVQARRLHPGDLLIEKSGGGERQPVGVVVLYDHDMPAVCSNFIARMRVAGGFSPRFLRYLHAAFYAARINTRSVNTTVSLNIGRVMATREARQASRQRRRQQPVHRGDRLRDVTFRTHWEPPAA